MTKDKLKVLLALHVLLVLFSCSGIMSKIAAGFPVLSWGFILCYGGMIFFLGIYAIGWQQIIKRLPLTTAYANRAVTVVWGIIWGALLFGESITPAKVIGALIVLLGVVLYATAKDEDPAPASPQDGGPAPALSQADGPAPALSPANGTATKDGER